MNPHETDELMVFFCSHVGGGIFGESEVGAWRASGMDAKMHCLVPLDRYWRAKSGGLARLQVRLLVIVLYSFMLKKLIASAKIGIVTNRYITFLVSPPPDLLLKKVAPCPSGRNRSATVIDWQAFL